jgi:hypothetical protein
MEDDRFRQKGSKYEHEEPIAFFLYQPNANIDEGWETIHLELSSIYYVPETLFVIGSNFAKSKGLNTFSSIDFFKTQSFNKQDCLQLIPELKHLRKADPSRDFQEFINVLVDLASQCVNSIENLELYATGP